MSPSANLLSHVAESSSALGTNTPTPILGTSDAIPGTSAPGSESSALQQSPRQSLAGPGDAHTAAHDDADQAMQTELPMQSQPSTEHAQPPDEAQPSDRDHTGKPDAPESPKTSLRTSAISQARPSQQGETSQTQSMGQPAGLTASSIINVPGPNAQQQSHAHHISIRAVESDQSDEDEEPGLDQEGDSVMQDEVDRLGDANLASGDADSIAGILADAAGAEAELPEEGWMW